MLPPLARARFFVSRWSGGPRDRVAACLLAVAVVPETAVATGLRRCELVLLDGGGARIAPSPTGEYELPTDAELIAVGACVDSISVVPQVSSHPVTPPDLRLERATACRTAAGLQDWGAPVALELVEAPDRRSMLRDPDALPYAWTGRLPPGAHQLLLARGYALVRVTVAGEASPAPCPAPPGGGG